MDYPKQLQVIEMMNRTTIGGKEWWYKVEDLDDANELLETAIRLMGIALGDFDVTDDLQMLDAQREALTLVDMSTDEKADAQISMMLPDTLTESRIVNQILARYAAHWLTVASSGQAHLNIEHLRKRITAAELALTNPTTNTEGNDCHE